MELVFSQLFVSLDIALFCHAKLLYYFNMLLPWLLRPKKYTIVLILAAVKERRRRRKQKI